jgi:hypothetical protein
MRQESYKIKIDGRTGKIISPFARRNVFLHTGHIGDIIAFLPSFKKLNGTHLVIKDEEPWMAPMSGFKYESIKPLLESQGIKVSFNDQSCIEFDMSGWRECYRDDISLSDAQARYCGAIPRNGFLELNNPWIEVEPKYGLKNCVIFNRTHRYNNPLFPWADVVKHYGSHAIFIGTDDEHEIFCSEFGKVKRYLAKDCLEIAECIAASRLFIGNQSSSFWIAAALRKPLIQEVYPKAPNSIIKYDGAQYSFDGKFTYV